MEISESKQGNVAIVAVKGKLDTNTADALQQRLAPYASERLVLDFAELNYISSAGLRVLMMAGKRLKAGGGAIALASVKDEIRLVLKITGLETAFPAYNSLDLAVTALAK